MNLLRRLSGRRFRFWHPLACHSAASHGSPAQASAPLRPEEIGTQAHDDEERPRQHAAGDYLAIQGSATPSEDTEAREAFLSAHPDARGYADFGDFGFWRISVERIQAISEDALERIELGMGVICEAVAGKGGR